GISKTAKLISASRQARAELSLHAAWPLKNTTGWLFVSMAGSGCEGDDTVRLECGSDQLAEAADHKTVQQVAAGHAVTLRFTCVEHAALERRGDANHGIEAMSLHEGLPGLRQV